MGKKAQAITDMVGIIKRTYKVIACNNYRKSIYFERQSQLVSEDM